MIDRQELQSWIEQYLKGTDYELITLTVSAANDILVEVDRLTGVDVDFCAELNRYLVEKLDAVEPDYSLEVGSVSLTDPFKTRMQYEKNLGHDVEVMICTKGQSTKYKGQLVSVDEETFSVDCAEKVAVEGKKLRGQLVSVDEETFSVDIEEKVKPLPTAPEGKEKKKIRPIKQIVTHTWRYKEPKYVKYDLKF